MTTIPEWLQGKQLSERELMALRAARVPDDTLGNLDPMKVPDEFVHLRAVADAIYNMNIYDGERETNCKTALSILDWIHRDLIIAKEDAQVTLAELKEERLLRQNTSTFTSST